MQRIVIIGTTGSGKSTLAQAVAQGLRIDFVDLDALHWQKGWQGTPQDVFRERVTRATAPECWVVSGNYSKVRDLIWTRADTLIWLDYPFPLVLWRLLRRTIRRVITREDLWGSGNRESWRVQFFSRDSLFLWALKTHWRYQRSIAAALRQPEYAHLHVLHFNTPCQTERWLADILRNEFAAK